MNDPHYDGDFSIPGQVGPAIPSIDERTRAKITRSTWWVKAANYQAQERGSVQGAANGTLGTATVSGLLTAAPVDGFLVEQGEPSYVGADVIEYQLTHAEVPAKRTEWEPWVYNVQYVIDGQIAEVPVKVNSRVEYSYYHIADPSRIELKEAFRVYQLGASIYYRGTVPKDNTWILGEDELLSRWMGDIWEVASRSIFYKGAQFLEP